MSKRFLIDQRGKLIPVKIEEKIERPKLPKGEGVGTGSGFINLSKSERHKLKLKSKQKLENTNPKERRIQKIHKVSVIMTVYNCQDYVERAINSVLNQTHKNLELLIIDDSSTDKSLEVISKYKDDPRVHIYKSKKNMGTYWCKNLLIKKCTGEYVTMLDSDDIDYPNKLERQISEFEKNPDCLLVTCKYNRIGRKISLGYPSAMWKRSVYDSIGFYDSIRFGADSEFYDRFHRIFGRNKRIHVDEVLQEGETRDLGLTGIVPETSSIRLEYLKRYKKWQNETDNENLYIEYPLKKRPFEIHNSMKLKNNSSEYEVEKVENLSDKLPIVMCVWQRLEGFKKTIEQLNNQSFQNFKLFVWCNNTDLFNDFNSILKDAKFEYEIKKSKSNIGGFGRFHYAKEIRLTPGLHDFVLFIDDDQTFGENTIETFFEEREKSRIKSQWGWKFSGYDYYANQISCKPGEEIHYAGTGGMICDSRIFSLDELFNCKEEYLMIEDLWLSFISNKILGWKNIKSRVKMKNGDDEHSLWKKIRSSKSPFLKYLITEKGWTIV